MNKRTLLLIASALAFLMGVVWIRCGPLPKGLLDVRNRQSTLVLDRRGEVLYEALSGTANRSEWMHANALPPWLTRATLAAEDRRFFQHIGVDPIAVSRAALHNLQRGRVVEGGSTITQQVAKQLAAHPRTFRGKFSEAVLALRLEPVSYTHLTLPTICSV